MILAILQRSTGLRLSGRDVFVNVTGGLTLHEPAADLAVAFAVASSALGRPLPARTVLAGELGLTGEIRAVPRLGDRLREAERLGMTRAIVPAAGDPIRSDGKLSAQTVSLVSDAFRAAFGDQIG
jgi:DNA repair protein RadA/Sms